MERVEWQFNSSAVLANMSWLLRGQPATKPATATTVGFLFWRTSFCALVGVSAVISLFRSCFCMLVCAVFGSSFCVRVLFLLDSRNAGFTQPLSCRNKVRV